MTNYDSWTKAMTPFTPADFSSVQEVRDAVQGLRDSNPDWNITEEQEEGIVAYWESQQN